MVTFDTLIEFMEAKSDVYHTGYSKSYADKDKVQTEMQQQRGNTRSSFAITHSGQLDKPLIATSNDQVQLTCVVCEQPHQLWDCPDFLNQDVRQRFKTVLQKEDVLGV